MSGFGLRFCNLVRKRGYIVLSNIQLVRVICIHSAK